MGVRHLADRPRCTGIGCAIGVLILGRAGWQANGSESVQVRELAQQHFGGNSSAAVQVVVHSDTATIEDAAMQQTLTDVAAVFDGDTRFGEVIAPSRA
ncbi:hypothetical protein GCM10020255_006710 [Rhodococcus baikonurensis]